MRDRHLAVFGLEERRGEDLRWGTNEIGNGPRNRAALWGDFSPVGALASLRRPNSATACGADESPYGRMSGGAMSLSPGRWAASPLSAYNREDRIHEQRLPKKGPQPAY